VIDMLALIVIRAFAILTIFKMSRKKSVF